MNATYAVDILARLNRARQKAEPELVAALEAELRKHDASRGYTRGESLRPAPLVLTPPKGGA